MDRSLNTTDRGDATRNALLDAALAIFAEKGFHAVSTREIANAAQANQALIGYHFRNKEGLYLAVFDLIRQQIQQRIGPFADRIEAQLQRPGSRGKASQWQREECLSLLLQMLDGMAALFVDPQSEPWGQLILREQQAPTKAFELLYSGFMGRLLALLTDLVRRIRPTDEERDLHLCVATLLGQVLVFRAARAGVLRHMGWSEIGPQELSAIQRQIRANVTAMLR